MSPTSVGTTEAALAQEPAYGQLRSRQRSFVFPMVVAFLLWYLTYVLLSAYARGFMAHKLLGEFNVALLLGLGQFLTTFAITWWYGRYAARRLDPLAAELRGRAHHEQ
jgi:uncharacterized membrane protein (DUF485 family)